MHGLAKVGIETRPFFYPAHEFPMYRQCRSDGGCPVACDLSRRGINLPTSSYLEEGDVEVITGAVRSVLARLEGGGQGERAPEPRAA
jgi:perosamine synthetase